MSKRLTDTTPILCQWCDARERPIAEGDGRSNRFAWVECPGCGASGPARETKTKAVAEWNQAMRWIAEGREREKAKEAAA